MNVQRIVYRHDSALYKYFIYKKKKSEFPTPQCCLLSLYGTQTLTIEHTQVRKLNQVSYSQTQPVGEELTFCGRCLPWRSCPSSACPAGPSHSTAGAAGSSPSCKTMAMHLFNIHDNYLLLACGFDVFFGCTVCNKDYFIKTIFFF